MVPLDLVMNRIRCEKKKNDLNFMDIVNFIPSFHNFFYKSSSIQRFYSKLIFIHTDVLLDAFSNFTSLPDSYLITFRFSNSLTKDVHRETERETSLL